MGLDATELQALRSALTRRRSELEGAADGTEEAAGTVELDQTRVGRLSRMDAMQSQAMAKETRRRHALERRRIDAALERMAEDDYGYCLTCGEEIAYDRLRIEPSATLCIRCAQRAEAEH